MSKNIQPDYESALKMIAELQTEKAAFKKQIEALKRQNEKLENLVHNLNEMLTKSRKMMFGKSSEQYKNLPCGEQISFFNEAEEETNSHAEEPKPETLVSAHTRKPKSTKAELTENLPHKEVVVDLKDDEKNCKICNSELVCIGKEKLRSELNIVPAQVFVIDYYRNVYKCPACEKETDEANIVKPDAPVAVMKKSMASPASVAYTIQEKYQNGVTLFRQEQYWKSCGVGLNRNTLANWIIRSSRWFVPIFDRMFNALLNEDIIHADETELRVLKQNGVPVNSMSRMWVFCSGKYSDKPMALYKYHPTRSAKVVEDILGSYSGYLQTDGYAAYTHAAKANRIGCWAHARRKWVDCLPKGIEANGSKASEALSLIEQLFSIEKSLVDVPEKEIFEQRLKYSKPLLEKYWKLLEGIDSLGGSALNKAVNYSVNNKKELNGYLQDGRLEMTNNKAERAVKPFVIARKNFLFSDTSKGADASAMCFSMIETAKLNNLNVYGYLIYLLNMLPQYGKEPTDDQLNKLMPWSKELPEYCKLPKQSD